MSLIFLCVVVTFAIIALLLFSKRKFDYWKKRNVPYLLPSLLLGNYGGYILLKTYVGKTIQNLCGKFPKEPYFGAFYGTEPTLIIQDPELIKLVMTKDFYYFSGREVSEHTHKEVMTQNLFFTFGDRWKVLRQNLTPLFSSAKMRNMFHLIKKCNKLFEDMLATETSLQVKELELRSLMVRYTMDCITSCAFGVNSSTMAKESKTNNPFRIMGDQIFEISNIRGIKIIMRSIWPSFMYALGIKTFPTEVNDFFNKLLSEIFQQRQYEPSSRNDFVDLMLIMKRNKYISGDSMNNMKNKNGEKINLEVSNELLMANCITFFAAGFETSASTMSYTLFELAKNMEVQKKAIAEVDEYLVRHEGEIEYDTLNELQYLEACVNEALRLYPVLGILTREVYEDYTFPNGLQIEKGIRVHIPVFHLHHNPDFFPDPEEFRPERFLPDAKKDIRPYTYLPFGEGPRVCIGMRFAKMQIMPGLVTVLKNYRLELASGACRALKFEPRALVTQSVGDIRLKFIPRNEKKHLVTDE